MLATVWAFKLGKADMSAAHQNFSFDPDKLRDKYRRERDKRIRVDGNDQYIEVTGDFSHYICHHKAGTTDMRTSKPFVD